MLANFPMVKLFHNFLQTIATDLYSTFHVNLETIYECLGTEKEETLVIETFVQFVNMMRQASPRKGLMDSNLLFL